MKREKAKTSNSRMTSHKILEGVGITTKDCTSPLSMQINFGYSFSISGVPFRVTAYGLDENQSRKHVAETAM